MFIEGESEALALQQKYYGNPAGLAQHLIRISLNQTAVVYEVFLLLDDYSTLDVGCQFIAGCNVYALVQTNKGLLLCKKLYKDLTTIRTSVVQPTACMGNAVSLNILKVAIETPKPPSKEKIEEAWESLQKCLSQAEKEYQRNKVELNRTYSAENTISALSDFRKLMVTVSAGIAWEISKAAGKVVLKRVVGGAVMGTIIQTAAESVYMTGAWFEGLWAIMGEYDEAIADCLESNEKQFQLSFRTSSDRNNISYSLRKNPRHWSNPMW